MSYHGQVAFLEAAVQAAQELRQLRRVAALQLVVQARALAQRDAVRAAIAPL